MFDRLDLQALLHSEKVQTWSGIDNLDAFFMKVYEYFVQTGFWGIILARFINLLYVSPVMHFVMFACLSP